MATLALVGDIRPLAGPSPKAGPVQSLRYPAMAAHRGGASVHPEGTMAAFRAIANKYPEAVLEMDIRGLADGTLVVHHDSTIDRTAANGETGAVDEKTVAQWKALRIKDPLGGPPQPAAFLADVLREFGGTPTVLMVELETPALRDRFIKTMWPYRDQSILCSFNKELARVFAGSGFSAQQLSAETIAQIPDGLNSIGVLNTRITSALCQQAHKKDVKVWAWGDSLRNNDPALLAMGVDGFIVDDPAL